MNGRVGGRAGSGGGASSSGQRGDQPARSVPRGGFTPIPRPRLTRWVSTPSGGRRGGAASPAFASSRADANGDDGDGSKRRGDRQVANVAGGWDAGGTSRPAPSARSRRKAKADKGGKISGTQGAPKAPGGTQDRGGPNSATELRREASAILRALSAARAAPGGLRATLGEEPALISRLLDALCAAGMLYQANALFREALDARVVASPFAVESLVRHGVKAGRAAEVAAAFDAYVAAGGSPTLRTYTDLITALSKRELQRRNRRSRQRFGDDKEHHDNTDVDAASGNRTSDAIDLWRALSTAETDDDALVPDAQAYTAAVGAFMAHGMVTEGDALVREMNRRGVAAGARLYNTLIAARGRLGDIDGVRAAERAMRDAGVRPNAATHGSRVAAYVRCGELELAERALRSGMGDRDEAKPTVHAYTALVQGLSRAGKVDEAREWIREMRRRRVPPNAHTYSTIVDALVRRGDVGGAEAVVEEMREDGVEPTAVTYNTLLKSCVSNRSDETNSTMDSASRDSRDSPETTGSSEASTSSSREETERVNLDRARRVLESMRAAGVDTTVVTYNTLIDACIKNGEPTEATMGVLGALVAAGHRPDVVTYTTLLKHFGKDGDVVAARWLMGEMRNDPGVRTDATAFNCLVDALCRKGLFAEAFGQVLAMIESGLSPDLNTFGAFMDGYARCGDVDGARALYATMTGRSESSRDGVWRVKDEDGDLIDFTADGSRDGSGTAKSSSSSPGVEVTTPPDARVRLALVTACARAGLTSAAEEVLTMIESDLASSSAGDDSAREMTELRERFRRELASSRVADGRTVARRVARRTKGRGGNGIARIKAADPRAGCPVPSSWGPAPRERRKRSAASSSSPIGSSIDVQVSRPSVDEEDTEWSRGLEMWKHWLGLPSRYYDGKGGADVASAKGQIQAAVKPPSESSASMNAMDPMETKAVPYTKGEIADAVRVLREAAAKRYPDDPDRALTLALEAAEDGDAARVLSRDEANATRDEDFSGDADGIDVA